MSKYIDRVDHDLNPDGTYNLSAIKDGQEVFSQEDIPASQLADHVGKEVAEKIIKGEGKAPTAVGKWEPVEGEGYRNWKSLSGLDLQVGGEGMNRYYGTKIDLKNPNSPINGIMSETANDLMKQIGSPQRTQVINFKPDNYTDQEWASHLADLEDSFESVPPHLQQGIEITPELREKIQSEGLPHYHDGGNVSKKVNLEDEFKIAQLRKNYG